MGTGVRGPQSAASRAEPPGNDDMVDLLYNMERPSPRIEAAIMFVLDNLRISAERADPPALWDLPHLVYGGAPSARPNGVVVLQRDGDIVWPELLSGAVDPARLDGVVAFDLLGAIAALLADDVHLGLAPAAFDEHERLVYRESLPARAGFGDRPIVDAYVAFLGRLLRTRLGVKDRPRWPQGRKAAIGLSHDVDLPDRYALLGSVLRPWRLRRQPRTYLLKAIELTASRVRDPAPSACWLFDEVMATEGALGFTSTFFFATVPFHATWGAPEDVAYDVGEPRFRRTVRSLRSAGFEVGLHASYRAHEDSTRMVAERMRLQAAADAEIVGVRHHYWHLGRDVAAALRAHEEAGLGYDSSIAFNDHVGFRRSVSLPFHPYDPVLRRPLRTLELPTCCMDGNLFYWSDDIEGAVAAVDAVVDQVAGVGGVAILDWHVQASYPAANGFHAWGVAYQEILRLLASRPELWVTDLGSIAAWTAASNRSSSPVRA